MTLFEAPSRPASEPARGAAPRLRLAIVATHPIQYYAPLYRALTDISGLELCVFFCSRAGAETYFDAGFGKSVRWANDLLGGYVHTFLEDADVTDSRGLDRLDNPSAAAALARFAPDCVLIQGYSVPTMRRALRWANGRGMDVLLFADSAYPDGVGFPKSLLKKLVLRHLYRRISGFLAMGDRGRAYHLHYGAPADRIYFCPYTIDEPLLQSSLARRADLRAGLRATLGLAPDDLALVFCGKLIPRKYPADLIHAVARLRADGVDTSAIVLLFCGDGELRADLERAARTLDVRAAFLGFRNMDTIGEVYCAADALALPSEREAYGVVLAEAAFFGLPLIVSDDVGALGPNSLACEGENTLVAPVGDHAALARAIRALLDRPVRARMGEMSRVRYERQTTAICAENIYAAAREVVAARPNDNHELEITGPAGGMRGEI